ncbi:sensor histidine kinase [Sphingomonas sp. Mn802worker]|uniref:sensor histidine kinase n=1 Tax=Sphingomonas sp. Mn802worker TaxID=629773 RepID=UPI00035F1B80|nr:HAMP domain-containing sensor histidine kinase [Sphingomonas sp. Mn802worker]
MTSLRSLLLAFLALFAAATVLTGYATFSASHAAISRLVDARIDLVADAVLTDVASGDARAILARIDRFSGRRDTGDIGFELEDARGRRLGGNVVLARAVAPGFSSVSSRDGIAGLTAGRAQSRDAGSGLRLITIAETEPVDGYAFVRARNYVIGFGAILLIVLAGTATFTLIVRRRIDEVRSTAAAIIDGDLRHRLSVPAHGGAFAAQAETFNRMLDRIAALMDGIRQISNEVAHDLRAPLARLHGRLALAIDADTPEAARREVEQALAQCVDMQATFSAILRIAEIEGGNRRAGFMPFDLTGLVDEIADTMRDAAHDRHHHLLVASAHAVEITGDRALIAQALLNLVENALDHTPPGSTVTIALDRDDAHVILRVTDNGPGIAAADRAQALRRFGRLDPSRHRPGHGLGLPLVDAIAQLHGGSLTLDDAAARAGAVSGLIATISLPMRTPEDQKLTLASTPIVRGVLKLP